MIIAIELRFCTAKIDAWPTFWFILEAPRLMVFIQSWYGDLPWWAICTQSLLCMQARAAMACSLANNWIL